MEKTQAQVQPNRNQRDNDKEKLSLALMEKILQQVPFFYSSGLQLEGKYEEVN
jgi:hypothetical protein